MYIPMETTRIRVTISEDKRYHRSQRLFAQIVLMPTTNKISKWTSYTLSGSTDEPVGHMPERIREDLAEGFGVNLHVLGTEHAMRVLSRIVDNSSGEKAREYLAWKAQIAAGAASDSAGEAV